MAAFLPNATAREAKAIIFDTQTEAIEMAASIQQQCARYGITLAVTIEQRICSPFSVTDPAQAFADEVERWAYGQGESS